MSLSTNIQQGVAEVTGRPVYPLVRPQGATLPVVTYQIISTPRQQTHSGGVRLVTSRVQFDAYATTYGAAEGVAEDLVAFFRDGPVLIGVLPAVTRVGNELDDYDPITGEYRRTIDVFIQYQEG